MNITSPWLLLAAGLYAGSSYASGLTKIASHAERSAITLEFDCLVRYDDHSPRVQGNQMRIKLRTDSTCELPLEQQVAEQWIPEPLQRVVRQIRIERHSQTASSLHIEFVDPMLFTARPGDAPNSVEVLTRAVATKPMDPILAADITATKASEQPKASAKDTAKLLKQGRDHLLREDYAAGIRLYQQLLALPDGGQHPEALEYLSLAYQMQEAGNGPSAQAQAGYESYLRRFPTSEGVARVQQRLDAMLATAPSPANLSREPALPPPSSDLWRISGGVTQDYWSATFDRDFAPSSRTRSALITLGNLQVDRRGDRYNLTTRIDAGYQNDFSDDRQNDENQALVANAYLDVRDKQLDWSARVGRQTLYADGVLGRFDGARFSYAWKPNIKTNLTAGFPVDSPRYSGDTRRRFVAASVDFTNLLTSRFDDLNTSLFIHRQSIDGIADREALGAQVNWRDGAWQASMLFDYDLSYAALNTALLHVGYQANQRLRLHGRMRTFTAPYLTTRNALIGQSVSTIEALQAAYSDAQLRTLARDRTADGLGGSLGFNAALGQRWNLNGDLGYLDTEGTIASGGVAAQPEVQQIYSALTLVGTSLVRPGDSAIFGFRLDSTKVADTSSLLFDFRLPIGPALRVGPRLRLSYRDASPLGDQQLILEPGLRVLYRWRARYRLELDAGYRVAQQEFNEQQQLLQPALFTEDTELSTELYFSLGWRVDF